MNVIQKKKKCLYFRFCLLQDLIQCKKKQLLFYI